MTIQEFLDNWEVLVKGILLDYYNWIIRSFKINVKERKIYVHLIKKEEQKHKINDLAFAHSVIKHEKYLTFNLNLYSK